MPSPERLARATHTMTVCNSCRYCEQFCPVFPAIERRRLFDAADLAYLANLCHNCGECLYACQYAPPHEFGIDVPRLLAELRVDSYEEFCWPRPLGRAFRHQGPAAALALAAGFTGLLTGASVWTDGGIRSATDGSFYDVIPHVAMVSIFGAAGLFVVVALAVSLRRFWRATGGAAAPAVTAGALGRAVREAAGLRHLHAGGADCVSAEEVRTPWRRWCHHATFGGFALTFASTSVAAVYHSAFGWEAPYPYTSLPVVLGTLGGIGLVIGPTGQWWLGRRRDPALADPAQRGMDDALLLLLWLTSVTGLLLLVLRSTAAMAPLLVVHLGVVLALFVLLPYGKFVHGFYRLLALVRSAAEQAADGGRDG